MSLRSCVIRSARLQVIRNGIRSTPTICHHRFYSDSSNGIKRHTFSSLGNDTTNIFNNNNDDDGEANLLKNHIPIDKCTSCGITLQETDPQKPGFFKKPEYQKPTQNKSEIEFMKAFSKLDEENKALLEQEMGISNFNERKERKRHMKRNSILDEDYNELNVKCTQCYDSLYHNKLFLKEDRESNYSEVMSKIPTNAQIVNVISAYDFPLGLMDFRKSSYEKGRQTNVSYVVNKVDLLFPTSKAVRSYAHKYFEKVIERVTGTSKATLVSAQHKWYVEDLLDKLPFTSYLVGFVNSGKSLLATELRNKAIHRVDKSKAYLKATGSFHIPALTKDNIEVPLGNKLTIDTPGILQPLTAYDHVQDKFVKNFLGGVSFIADRMRKMKYDSVHGGKCYTMGGLFYLLPPQGTLLQVLAPNKGSARIASSLNRAMEIVREPANGVKNIYVKPESVDKLKRYVIPPFFGKIDLVIKDYGFVQIKPVGKKITNELFEVWAPEGVIMCVRRSIVDYITKNKFYDTQRHPIQPGDFRRARYIEPTPIPDDKLFTRLYEIPKDCDNTFEEMERQYSEILEQEGSTFSRPELQTNKENPDFKYWIEKLYK
ncbi:hypothetical protein BN7_3402 [Wickerhamomyces ciferrii]|uniref:Genetic interactor of prohibitins 3, mitochondrial n=1 Tax=Wickerhamomyces ciferrii (strain ATCC 14091 / BCRC 22168 / CBS 111 / JCM 3599 / NBRC 0793 / NRRL Y-1031 F-60-10) TaxID=1206466 RepID=K0KRB6_WICCF|nr:uncharacterized protein BN7_3402 [Wickerhamomyces ciferrii]CCH43848.1 hypothetical protein BN7_3402 [Wickerhamomyces ciferrii]